MRVNMDTQFKKGKGLTLIELMVAMAISAILIAAIYRTFISQQKTYTVQEQVVDMQQNVRVAINKMMREIRMAGFGNVSDVIGLTGGVNGFIEVITPAQTEITILLGSRQISTLAADAIGDRNQITLANAEEASQFDGTAHRFISIGGIESNTIQSRSGAILTLDKPLKLTHKITDLEGKPLSVPVFKIQAITYKLGTSDGKPVLQRNENTGGGSQPLAENIENLQFEYLDANGITTTNPGDIRMIRVTITARTRMADPEFKGGAGGFRRRTIASNIHVRNMGLNP